jgi:hypothetical protein
MPMLNYAVKGYYRVKIARDYPAPCEPLPDRMYHLFTDDVLTKDASTGTYTVHTGIMLMGIVLTDDEVDFFPGVAKLVGV